MHDLHVWSISGQNALSCHVVVDGTISIQESQEILRTIEDELEDENIGHATIQMESENHPHKDSVMCRMMILRIVMNTKNRIYHYNDQKC